MQRLKKLREDRGLTQKKLSSEIHVSQQRISAYENEKSDPPLDVLKSYAEYFSTSTDYLLSCDKNTKQVREQAEYLLNEDEMKIINAYRGISEANKKIIRTVASTCYEIENNDKEH